MAKIRMMLNKGLLQIFFALLLVVALMFASNYIVYKNSISGIYDQVSENNKLVVKNIIRSFDDRFKEINDIIHSIQMLPYDTWSEIDAGRIDMHDAYMTQKNISELISSIDYIENVIVFHGKSDLAITSAGTIHLDEQFKQKYINDKFNLSYWKTLAASRHPLRMIPAQDYKSADYGGQSRKFLVVVANNQLSDQNIMVFVDAEKLLRQVNQTAMMKGTSLIVMDQDKSVILNTENNWDIVELLNDVYDRPKPDETVRKKDYEYNFFTSDYNGFTYIHKAPYEFANMKSVNSANRMIMLTAIICAVVLSALLSLYLYKPVRVILKLVGGREQEGADFRSIFTGISKIQEENESYRKQMAAARAEVRKAAFLQALEGVAHSRDAELRMQQHVSDLFQEAYFMLAAFDVDFAIVLAASMHIEELNKTIESELRRRLGYADLFHAGSLRFIALIGIRGPADREHAVRQVRSYVKQAKNEAGKDLFTMTAVSRVYAALTANCRPAYQDLADCCIYRNIHSDDPVTDYGAIRFTWKVHLPLDEIERASHCLMGGNAAECLDIIDDILAKNVERRIHHHHLVSVAKTIYHHIVRQLELSSMESKDVLAVEKDFISEVAASHHYEGVRNALARVVAFIAERGGHEQKTKLQPSFVARYIELHYMDNLHLELMAEQFGTTPKYFSNYFKKAFDVNFVEYLNKVRLSHAKELLKNTDKSVAEIGELTGYLNSSTFTSTFKKYYGISPSEYRKIAVTDQLSIGGKKG